MKAEGRQAPPTILSRAGGESADTLHLHTPSFVLRTPWVPLSDLSLDKPVFESLQQEYPYTAVLYSRLNVCHSDGTTSV